MDTNLYPETDSEGELGDNFELFPVLVKNSCCEYSLKALQRSPQHIFVSRNKNYHQASLLNMLSVYHVIAPDMSGIIKIFL